MKKLLRIAGLSVMATGMALPAAHADYPDKPLRVIVPFEPGGTNDVVARVVGTSLGKVIGQPVVVENRGGVAGNLGAAFVAKSAPDGYTLLSTGGSATQNPALYRNLGYDPVNDLTPVAMLSSAPRVFAANLKLPFKGLKELIEYARQNPGKLNAAAGGVTTSLESEMFRLKNNISIEIIPYSGTGRASTAVLSGEADFVIMETSPVVSLIKGGKMRALAIVGTERHPVLSDIPTTKEQGFPDFVGGSTSAAFTRLRTPRDIQQKLNTAFNKAVSTPEMTEWFTKVGARPINMELDELRSWYLKELADWKDVVTRAKIPPAD